MDLVKIPSILEDFDSLEPIAEKTLARVDWLGKDCPNQYHEILNLLYTPNTSLKTQFYWLSYANKFSKVELEKKSLNAILKQLGKGVSINNIIIISKLESFIECLKKYPKDQIYDNDTETVAVGRALAAFAAKYQVEHPLWADICRAHLEQPLYQEAASRLNCSISTIDQVD